MSAFRSILEEADRVHRESGRPALFLLISPADYRSLCDSPLVDDARRYTGAQSGDAVLVETVCGLRVVVDPNRRLGFAVLGEVAYEAQR